MAQGGKTMQDRELAARVRKLALGEIEEILLDKESKVHAKSFRNQVILKLASTVLPRLNEITGEDGKDLFPKPLLGGASNGNTNNDSIKKTPITKEGNTSD